MNLFPKPNAVTEHDYRVYVIIAIVVYIGAPVHFFLIFFFALIGAYSLAILNIFSCVAWVYSYFANRLGDHQKAINLVTIEVFTHSVACVAMLGLGLGFQHYLWGGLTFIMLNNWLNKRSITLITTGLGLVFVLLTVLAADVHYRYAYPQLVPVVNVINIMIAFVASGLVSYHFRKISQEAEQGFKTLATTDSLTGLFNRRHLSEEIDKRMALANREHIALSLVLADIDYFKKINDTLGHDAGDAVLREVAHRLATRIRKTDLIGRWGGEEFLILLHHHPHQTCEAATEQLRQAVAHTPIVYNNERIAVTMTFGGAYHAKGETVDACIKRADLALYHGKQAGRNRVEFKEI